MNNGLESVALASAMNAEAKIPAEVSSWLEDNVDPSTGYVIDKTLTISDAAADAKVTGDEIREIKSAIEDNTNTAMIQMNPGHYYNTNSDINIASPDTSTHWECAYVSCTPGDMFRVRAYSEGASIRPWAFIDSNGVILSKGPYTGSLDVELVAPSDSAYLIINNNKTTAPNNHSYKGKLLVNRVSYTENEIAGYKFPDLFVGLDAVQGKNLYNCKTATDNGYVSKAGAVSSSTSYCYSAKIPVVSSKTYSFWAFANGAVSSQVVRFLCAYNGDSAVSDSGAEAVYSYTVPDGIDSIVVSFAREKLNGFMLISGTTQPTEILPYCPEHYTAKDMMIADSLFNQLRGKEYVEMHTASATANQEYDLIDHLDNKKNCAYNFFGKFNAFTSLQIGHGQTETGACYMIIDGTNVTTYDNGGHVYSQVAHGLTISDFIAVSIKNADTKTARAKVNIITNGGEASLSNIIFLGCNGKIHYICGQTTTDVDFSYSIMDLRKDVYVFGDSYTSLASDARWPEYALTNDDNNILISGFAGADSGEEYPSFENIVAMRKPKYVCWLLGMNDADIADSINTTWLETVERVVGFCTTNGVTPILATIPNTPTQRHIEKNAWVKASGLRYVDFAKAVGAESAGASWYTGMLSSDNVHPTAEGAKALWLRMRLDVPEIMQRFTT